MPITLHYHRELLGGFALARLSHQLSAATANKAGLPTLFLSFDLDVTRHAVVRKSAHKYRHINLLYRLATKPGEIAGLAGLIPGLGSLGRDSEPHGPDFRPSTILRCCRDLVNEKTGKYDDFEPQGWRDEFSRLLGGSRAYFGVDSGGFCIG